jgi:hypothetical protein
VVTPSVEEVDLTIEREDKVTFLNTQESVMKLAMVLERNESSSGTEFNLASADVASDIEKCSGRQPERGCGNSPQEALEILEDTLLDSQLRPGIDKARPRYSPFLIPSLLPHSQLFSLSRKGEICGLGATVFAAMQNY